MTNEKDSLHVRVTALVESTHCPKHGMEWEACCYSEVVLELHNKITDLITTIRGEEKAAAFKEVLDATTRVHLATAATGSAEFQEGIRNGVILGANQIRDVIRAAIEAAATKGGNDG